MRLIARTLYRAFPELDPYDDEQCLRFVKAARGSLLRRALHVSIIILVLLPLFVGAIYFAAMLSDYFDLFNHGKVGFALILNTLLWMAGTACVLAVPLLSAYYLRDFLLSRRLKTVLRTRGACPSCGYSVVGLAVTTGNGAKSFVTCPECGVKVEVDPSLAVLTRDGAGTPGAATGLVIVGDQAVEARPRWHRFPRVSRRTKILIALTVFTLPALLLGLNELFIHWQASRAKSIFAQTQAEMNTLAGLNQAAATTPGVGSAPAPSIWTLASRMSRHIEQIDQATWQTAGFGGIDTVYPDFTSISDPWRAVSESTDPDITITYGQGVGLARALIAQYEAEGVFDGLAELNATLSLGFPPESLSVDYSAQDWSIIGASRALSRTLAGRLAVAAEHGDRDAALQSAEAILALAAANKSQPFTLSQLHGVAIDSVIDHQLRRLLFAGRIKPSWIPDLQNVLTRRWTPVDFVLATKGERLMARGSVAKFFENPGNARFGRLSKGFRDVLRITTNSPAKFDPLIRLGTLSQNLDEIDARFSAFAASTNQEAWQRVAAAAPPTTNTTRLGLVRIYASPWLRPELADLDAANHRGTLAWLAVERYAAHHGVPPDSLAQLAPFGLPEIPTDPWTGKPMLYKRVDPAADEHRRRYLLYFTGPDGTDEGGIGIPNNPMQTPAGPASIDHVVNDPRR
jgi:hypothetical protein